LLRAKISILVVERINFNAGFLSRERELLLSFELKLKE